jgi:exonuclease SbcD
LEAEALIVTGDIYDAANPPVRAQQQLYRFLNRVLRECPQLQVVLIGGNHDSAGRLELPRHLLDGTRVFVAGAMPRSDGRIAPEQALIELRSRAGGPGALCAAVPYLRPADLPVPRNGEHPVEALYRQVLASAEPRMRGLPLIVTGHFCLLGACASELSERSIAIGGEEAVSAAIFPAGIAYVALGHLHKPQAVAGRAPIRYAGSPFPLSLTEADYPHSIVVLDLDQQGRAAVQLVRTPRPVGFHRVPGAGAARLAEVEEALRRLDLADPGANRRPFLEVAVVLDGAEPDLRRRIDAALDGKPVRLTRIVRQTQGGREPLGDAAGSARLDDLAPGHVFKQCHRGEFGREPSEELKQAFARLLAEVLAEGDEEAAAA